MRDATSVPAGRQDVALGVSPGVTRKTSANPEGAACATHVAPSGLSFLLAILPRAYARGYNMPPLRG